MSLLDDVVINVKSAAEAVGEKAGKLVDISKLRINVSELNNEINKKFCEVGQYIYDGKKNGSVNDGEISEKLAEIDELYEQMALVMEEMSTLKNRAKCPECGNYCDSNSVYCPQCGSRMPGENN